MADQRTKTVHAYAHQARIGVLVEVSCVTDFAAKTQLFTEFCRDLCMQVAAMDPAGIPALLKQDWVKCEGVMTAKIVDCLSAQLGETVIIEAITRREP